MQNDHQRDDALDRLLRQTMSERARDVMGSCPDGETVAAWAEHALHGDDAAAIETHLAQCARCQALLAAFARATPAPEVTRSLWERWRLQWLVPIGAAATAVAIWVAVPSNPPPTPAMFESSQGADAEPQQQAPGPPTVLPTSPPDASPQRTAAAPPTTAPVPDERSAAAKATPAPAVGGLDARETAGFAAAEEDASANRTQASARAADASAPAAAGAADRARAEAAPAPAPPAAPPVPTERRAPALMRQEVARPEIVSPNPARRWRVTQDGQVERSVSGGSAWERAVIDPPAVITTGSSPDPLVCWLVGRGGAVYLTTDGIRFLRISFPATADLVAVSTPDARSATVMSADGLSWRTSDLGRSWTGPTR